MNKKFLIFIVLALFTVGAIFFALPEYHYRYSEVVIKKSSLKLPTTISFEQLASDLAEGGHIEADPKELAKSLTSRADGDTIKAGYFVLEKGFTARQIVNTLTRGYQTPVRVTFNNVRTIAQLAGRVAQYTMADSLEFITAFRSPQLLENLGRTAQTLPAIFLPNTYEFYWDVTPEEFALKMNSEQQKFWNQERLAKAEALGFSPDQITTIASIVSEETNKWDEMTNVAGVYINRLRVKMPLQADPTVKFAIGDFSIRRVLNKHLEYRSPYNTYLNAGLPPGPICLVDGRVIDKVLDYTGHKYYYFCARDDFSGYHAFASNLSQHNRNAAAYHRALNRRNIK